MCRKTGRSPSLSSQQRPCLMVALRARGLRCLTLYRARQHRASTSVRNIVLWLAPAPVPRLSQVVSHTSISWGKPILVEKRSPTDLRKTLRVYQSTPGPRSQRVVGARPVPKLQPATPMSSKLNLAQQPGYIISMSARRFRAPCGPSSN
jgi:hypothetical protein